MTTLEHAMLGINGVLAVGLDRRWGWQLCAMAATAAVLPDWDGMTILGSVSLFDMGHRVWGHALLICVPLAMLFASLDYRYDLMTRCARGFIRVTHLAVPDAQLTVRTTFVGRGFFVWMIVAIVATLSHLLGDVIVSGTAELSDWAIRPLWPFRDQGIVYPLVPWGDPGITILFVIGMFAMLRWKKRLQSIAIVTLVGIAIYAGIRGCL